jgi:hypothetical protein
MLPCKCLIRELRAARVTGWLDDADAATGEGIPFAVRNTLKKSSAVVVLLSPKALTSQWVQFELDAAEALDKKIIAMIVSRARILRSNSLIFTKNVL